MSIRAIARQLSCSRETVHRYIRSPLTVADMRYKPRAPSPCKLDQFKPYILERLAVARPHWIPASVLLRAIRQRGYDGGYSMLTAFLYPMSSLPGFQMQVDFTITRLGHNPLLAFVATLGWSRATFVKFYNNQDSAAWSDGIESALRFFGGTPHQLLFDNTKVIIIERDVYGPGKHRWNPQLMHVAEKYAFTPKVCRPYRAKTKGKVERFNHYLNKNGDDDVTSVNDLFGGPDRMDGFLDIVARLKQHIPEKYFRMVRYFGFLANKNLKKAKLSSVLTVSAYS